MPSVASIAIATPATAGAPSATGGTIAGVGTGGPFLDFMAGFLASLQTGTGEALPGDATAETGLPAPHRRRAGGPGSEDVLGETIPSIAPPIGLVPPALLMPLTGEGAGTAGATPAAAPGTGGPATIEPPSGPTPATPAAGKGTPPTALAGPDFAAALAALGLTPPPADSPDAAAATAVPSPIGGADGLASASNSGVSTPSATVPPAAGNRTGAPAGTPVISLPAGVVATVRTAAGAAEPAPTVAEVGRPADPAAPGTADPVPMLTAAETEAALDLEGAPEADAARPVETRRDPTGSTGGGATAGLAAQGAAAAAGLVADKAAEAGEETAEPGLPPISDAGASTSRTTATAAPDAAQPGTPDAPRTAPAEQVAAALHGAQQRGDRRLEIRLDPPELGKVDVRMQIGPEGEVRAHLVVERAETLDMMLRDQRGLERALEQTGVKLADAGVSFSLRQEGGDGRGDQRTPYGETRRAEVADAQASGEPIPPASPYGRPTRTGGIDLRV